AKPFPDLTPTSLFYKHLNEPLPSLRERRPDFPDAVDAVIQKATAKKPEDRYPDALSMAVAFRRAIGKRITGESPTVEPSQAGDARTSSPELHTLEDTPTAVIESDAVLPEPDNPYKGPQAFQEADAADYFGREAMTDHLLQRFALTATPSSKDQER